MSLDGYRVTAVHAHPDDETLWTGGTLARLARLGAEVTVLTCTMGECGEVIGEPYAALVAGGLDMLGPFRIRELADALAALGVNGAAHVPRFLGGIGRWRDSGMAGTPTAEHPRAFVSSGEEAVAALAAELGRLRPHLVLTYDADGGYGHPDHIRAHEITVAATARLRAEAAGGADADLWGTAWAVTDRAAAAAGFAAITEVPAGWLAAGVDDIATAEGGIAVHLAEEDLAAKRAAMAAHATQVWLGDGRISDVNPTPARGAVDSSGAADGVWALSNLLCQPLLPVEHYRAGSADPALLDVVLGAR